MNKPAARRGDITIHGGCIISGASTVLIENQPAARITDQHVCPLHNPGGSPHVGGPVVMGSANVIISGQKAARIGDMCTCMGPPDAIATGSSTVLIGESTWASSSIHEAEATLTATDKDGQKQEPNAGPTSIEQQNVVETKPKELSCRETPESDETESSEEEREQESHYLDVSFVDKAGYPIRGVHYELTSPDQRVNRGRL